MFQMSTSVPSVFKALLPLGEMPRGYGMLPNGLELCCPAARASWRPFSRNLAGRAPQRFRPPAGSASASC